MTTEGYILAAVGGFLFAALLLVIIYAAISSTVHPIPPPLPPCSETTPSITIPADMPTCIGPLSYYIEPYGMVVTPIPIPQTNVCAPKCTLWENGACVEGKDIYNECVSSITNSSCEGPLPIAKKDGVLYYPNFSSNICI